MTLTVGGRTPSTTRVWTALLKVRGVYADIPGGVIGRIVAAVGSTADDTPPATAADISHMTEGNLENWIQGSYLYTGAGFDKFLMQVARPGMAKETPAEGEHYWAVVWDGDASDPKPILAYADITPA